MKLHRTLVQAVAETLQNIFTEGVYADKAVEEVLKQNARWGSRDRRFIAEAVYEVVRWKRLLSAAAGMEEPQSIDDIRTLIATWLLIHQEELPAWEEFASIDKEKITSNYEKVKHIRKYRESVPDWMDELGSKELGEVVWEKELQELNKEAKVVLRTNTLKISADELKKKLSGQGIEVISAEPAEVLVLSKRRHLSHLEEYKKGLFEIQDASSQLIAPFMELKPGMTVIDACAGGGGKSLHIAAMLQNKGKIISMDVEERKIKELERRAERAGVKIIQTKLINPQVINHLKDTADRLLLDVPCSGLGVIRRNPDAKWKLSLGFIENIKKVQQEIISNYSRMLKPGGTMVYATCSILPSENQDQVEKFLNANKKFEFISDRKVMPTEGFDGFYMAKLVKSLT